MELLVIDQTDCVFTVVISDRFPPACKQARGATVQVRHRGMRGREHHLEAVLV